MKSYKKYIKTVFDNLDFNINHRRFDDMEMHENNKYSNSIANSNNEQYSIKRENLDGEIGNYETAIKDTVRRKDGELKNTNILNEQGNVAETHHEITYNIDSAAQGRDNQTYAKRTKYGDPTTDIKVTDGNDTIDYQLKYEDNPNSNIDSLSNPKYSDGKKVAPADQVEDIRTKSSNKTNTDNKDYTHTSENTYDRISSKDGKVNSDPLTRDESIELTDKARKGEKIEYKHAEEKRNIQFRNQLGKAALVGGAFAAGGALFGEIMKFIENGGNLTEEEFIQGFLNVAGAGVDGASKSALAVSLHYLGKNIGSSVLSNPYVGAGVAVVAIDTLKSLYRFASGKIDSIELVGEVSKNITETTMTSLGAAAGSYLAGSITSLVTANMTMSAAAAATFGTISTIVGSVLGGLAFGLATSWIITSDSKAGIEIAKRDIENAYAEFKKDKNLYRLVDNIGTQRDWEFSLRNMIPIIGGVFSQISEYGMRRDELKYISASLDKEYGLIDEEERKAIDKIRERAAIIENNMKEAFYTDISHMFQNDVIELHNDLMKSLNAKRNIFALKEKKYFNELKDIDDRNALLDEIENRDQLFYDEIDNLINILENSNLENKETIIGAIVHLASKKFAKSINSSREAFYELLIEDDIL